MKQATTQWNLGYIKLSLQPIDEHYWGLSEQTEEGNLLTSLVDIAYPAVSRSALDMLFQNRLGTHDDEFDAMRAYSRRPLPEPPQEYLDLCREDWNPTMQYRAIVLAGSKVEADQELLLNYLRALASDSRDAPLFAASSFRDQRFVEEVARIAMSIDEDGAYATGEIRIYRECFNWWINSDFLTLDQVENVLRKYEKKDGNYLSVSRLMNFIYCPGWKHLPYPEEVQRLDE